MTYRNDIDALEARKAALEKDVTDKSAERDEVGRLLDEARAEQAIERRLERKAQYKRLWRRYGLLAVIVIAMATLVALRGWDRGVSVAMRANPDRVYTCEELQPEHLDLVSRTQNAYTSALAAKRLSAASLTTIHLTGWPGVRTIEELDKLMGRSANAWEVIPYVHEGVERNALVGEIIETDVRVGPEPDFVRDNDDNIWRVVRAPKTRVVRHVRVDACEWGCWGSPPSGMAPPHAFDRQLWILPERAKYRGEVTIEYEEPVLETENLQNCPPPA